MTDSLNLMQWGLGEPIATIDVPSRSDRRCDWCKGPIAPSARRDSITCSKRCRQARHRFHADVGTGHVASHRGAAPAGATGPLNLAYADPPYPGMSRRYYGDHPDYAGEVDHADLIRRLSTFDGWALSTHASSLQAVLALCPPGVRVASWHRGERPNQKAGVPLVAWEPVIFAGGRRNPSREYSSDASRDAGARRTDTLVHHSRPRLTDPARVIGAKPATFIRWMFDLLGAEPQDTLTDLFPGSGGVDRAWAIFTAPPNP